MQDGTTELAIEYGKRGQDVVSCTDIALNTLLNIVFAALNIFLILFIVKVRGCEKTLFKDFRLWIPVANLMMNLCLIVINVVDTDSITGTFNLSTAAFSRLFKIMTIFLVVLFFNQQSRQLLLPKD